MTLNLQLKFTMPYENTNIVDKSFEVRGYIVNKLLKQYLYRMKLGMVIMPITKIAT